MESTLVAVVVYPRFFHGTVFLSNLAGSLCFSMSVNITTVVLDLVFFTKATLVADVMVSI